MKVLLLFTTLIVLIFIPAGSTHGTTVPSDQTDSVNLTQAAAADAGDTAFVYPLSPERKELLVSYSRFTNIWRFVIFFVDVIILILLLYLGISGKLKSWAVRISRKRFFTYLFYFLFFYLLYYLLTLPFNYYRDFVIEHRYGFSNQNLAEWFGENLKMLGITFVIGFIVILIAYWLINRFRRWWLYFAAGMIPFMVLIIIIFPVFLAPMFNKFEPLKDQNLAAEMTQLADRAGIVNPNIFQVDASKQSKKLNAYFTGMFGTKRIVLYDNIINALSVNELKFVMGHEIGHYKMNHIWKGLILAVLIMIVAGYLAARYLPRIIRNNSLRFGYDRLGDIASLPLLLLFLTVFSFVTQPVQNAVSRYHEYKSDDYGLRISGVTAREAATAFDKLSVYNLGDPDPSPIIEYWFYDHPALKKRIDNANKMYHIIHTGT